MKCATGFPQRFCKGLIGLRVVSSWVYSCLSRAGFVWGLGMNCSGLGLALLKVSRELGGP